MNQPSSQAPQSLIEQLNYNATRDTELKPPPTSSLTYSRAQVYDASTGANYGNVDNLTDGSEAAIAAHNVQRGLDYLSTTFGRDGIDGAGNGVNVLINDRSTNSQGSERFKGNGGYYAMPDASGNVQEAIHFGTGTSYEAQRGTVDQRSMLNADDLTVHELIHGVIRKETGHLGGDADEAGATNEAIADVMAAASTRDWVIGEGMYSNQSAYRNMRNLEDPNDSTSIHGLWTSMQDVATARSRGGEIEEHWASGIISTAAQRTQANIGGEQGWQAVERIFYDSIVNGQLGDMSFASVANSLRTSAASIYGSNSREYQALNQELSRAGL